MKNTPNKSEGRDGKKFLKTQIYTISDKLGKAIDRLDEENKPAETERWERIRKESESIKDILTEKSDLLVKRAIVWDIRSYTKRIWWEDKMIVQFKCKYGLWITVDNLNSFLDFCAIHGFIPMVDKIFIESDDGPKI